MSIFLNCLCSVGNITCFLHDNTYTRAFAWRWDRRNCLTFLVLFLSFYDFFYRNQWLDYFRLQIRNCWYKGLSGMQTLGCSNPSPHLSEKVLKRDEIKIQLTLFSKLDYNVTLVLYPPWHWGICQWGLHPWRQ